MAHDGLEKLTPSPDTVCGPASEERLTKGKEHDDTFESRSIHSDHSGHSTVVIQHDVEIGQAALTRTITPKRPVVKVPRSERRGLFARFCVMAEVTEPTDYSNSIKWFITFVVAITAAAAPVASAIILPTLDEVARSLHTDATTTNLSVSLYMLSMAIFPLWWSAFSETAGRRTVYITSFALFILFSVLSAVSHSISMLIVMRLLAGGASASVQAVGAGTLADIWKSHERGRAMGIYFLGPLCGPLLAPIVGGILGQVWDWRATQWALAIYGVLTWALIFFGLPETLKIRKDVTEEVLADVASSINNSSHRPSLSRTSTREVIQDKSKKYLKVARTFFLDPLSVILYLRFMPVLLTVYYSAVTFGALYMLNISIQYSFEREPYDFSTIIIGLLYLPNSIGYILASVLGGRWMDYIMRREAIKANRVDQHGKLIFRPEDRMRENAWLGALIYPCALIWYGWTVEKGVLWVAPAIANFFYGVGSMLIFAMSTTMLTEFMPQRSSSGVALNNLCRNLVSCVGTVVVAPLIAAIGNGWLFTILGLWALSSASVIWAMKRYGENWREKMDRQLR
ncbi:Major Facilitator Superfamily protein [Fonsecaea pedrosoi]|nr:Major Facilitator Superfamily protein [Fonsecaea pedrosoi]